MRPGLPAPSLRYIAALSLCLAQSTQNFRIGPLIVRSTAISSCQSYLLRSWQTTHCAYPQTRVEKTLLLLAKRLELLLRELHQVEADLGPSDLLLALEDMRRDFFLLVFGSV